MKFRRGATGAEMVPHREFWLGFPGLVKVKELPILLTVEYILPFLAQSQYIFNGLGNHRNISKPLASCSQPILT